VDAARLKQMLEARTGRRIAVLDEIPAGMGSRRFVRVRFSEGEPRSAIARCEPDAPTAPENASTGSAPSTKSSGADAPRLDLPPAPAWLPEPPLEPLRGFLESAGLRVPRSFGHFPEQGIELLEDVGSRNLLQVDPAVREALYRAACAFVPRLQALSAPASHIPAFGRRYDRALVDTKRWKWLHWTLPGLLGRAASDAETRATDALFRAIADLLEEAPRRLAHRDFKAENIHLLPAAAPNGQPELVLIDVQGAFLAPPEYDLVCLLDDLQTDLDAALADRLFLEILPSLPDRTPPETARLRFDAIAVARLCKDVAHVVHAGLARGDRRRWREIPRGLELLTRAASRLEATLPDAGSLISVIAALTTALEATDSGGEGRVR
jgi:aminoglycoside/choline kinase family phosphotransferase